MTSKDAVFAAMDGAPKPKRKRKPSGDPGGWKPCTDKCIKVEARLAKGCICPWGCFKENQYARTKHIRKTLNHDCVKHSPTAYKQEGDE